MLSKPSVTVLLTILSILCCDSIAINKKILSTHSLVQMQLNRLLIGLHVTRLYFTSHSIKSYQILNVFSILSSRTINECESVSLHCFMHFVFTD